MQLFETLQFTKVVRWGKMSLLIHSGEEGFQTIKRKLGFDDKCAFLPSVFGVAK